MRKRSTYRPKGVRLDNMGYVLSGMMPVRQVRDAAVTLKIKNHLAMENLRTGNGTREDMDVVIGALNITEALAMLRIGNEYADEIKAGQDGLFSMGRRSLTNGRLVFAGPELAAVNLAMEIHDAQLDLCTVAELERAMDIVRREIVSKRARPIVTRAAASN